MKVSETMYLVFFNRNCMYFTGSEVSQHRSLHACMHVFFRAESTSTVIVLVTSKVKFSSTTLVTLNRNTIPVTYLYTSFVGRGLL
jgi:hypothetical protein